MPTAQLRGRLNVHFLDEGEGSPLVLLHGLGGSARVWDEAAEGFVRYHRVIRPDLRGFGQSDHPPGPYAIEDYTADLAALLDHLRLDQAHVLGISMGGVIAQRFVLDYPERVRSVVLVSTSSEVGPRAQAAWLRLADLIESRGFGEGSADASRSVSPAFAARYPEKVRALGEATRQCDPRAYAAAARAVAAYNFTAELARVRQPVLILQGLDDQLTPPGGSVKMARALPHARLLFVPEAGHNLPMEQPQAFVFSVLGFLGGVENCAAKNGVRDD
ncbi:MAG: 3-oxoadipate enol-lactonase [Candidatus Binatia bacterium]|nr:MAG: 3-oxoadipate enol-lactonase [Candidatus Binatia bacterium]